MANLPTSIKNLNTLLGEQLTEGGGGGSSDFSTATVTFVNNSEFIFLGGNAAVLDDGEHACVHGMDALADNESYTFILYKGLNVFTCNNSNQFTVTTSGNVTYDSEEGTFLITGDCTITIS